MTVEDALRRYHKLGRFKGRTTCPIHGGKRDNLGYNDLTWHCFVCGASGDVISFVMQMFGLDFPDALTKLSSDFGIQIDGKSTDIRTRHKLSMQDTERKLAELRKKNEHEKLKSEYWRAFDEYAKADRNIRECAPKSPEDKQNPLFISALQNIGYATYRLQEADEKLNEYERADRHS